MLPNIDKASQRTAVNLPESLALFRSLRWMSRINSVPRCLILGSSRESLKQTWTTLAKKWQNPQTNELPSCKSQKIIEDIKSSQNNNRIPSSKLQRLLTNLFAFISKKIDNILAMMPAPGSTNHELNLWRIQRLHQHAVCTWIRLASDLQVKC